jgi:hypothetical protein
MQGEGEVMTNNEIRQALASGRKLRPVYSPKTVFIISATHAEGNLWYIELNNSGKGLNAAANIVGDPLPRPPQDAMKRFIKALTP